MLALVVQHISSKVCFKGDIFRLMLLFLNACLGCPTYQQQSVFQRGYFKINVAVFKCLPWLSNISATKCVSKGIFLD